MRPSTRIECLRTRADTHSHWRTAPVRIDPAPASLFVEFDISSRRHRLQLLPTYSSALDKWRGSTRVSPIWATRLGETEAPANFHNAAALVFLGPIDPARVHQYLVSPALEGAIRKVFLTLGVFNVILVAENDVQLDAIRNFIAHFKLIGEIWCVQPLAGEPHSLIVTDIEYLGDHTSEHPLRTGGVADRFAQLRARVEAQEEGLHHPLLEFLATSTSIRARAANIYPDFSQDLDGIEWTINELMRDTTSPRARDILVAANAALSRQASQALSGTTPLVQTECHFWPHSFLGTGIANIALRRVVEFIHQAFDKHFISARIEALISACASTIDAKDRSCFDLKPSDIVSFVAIDHPSLAEPAETLNDFAKSELPIAYYSARDGFRTSELAISAPLLSISGCGSRDWSLLSLTHEISHRLIADKLYVLALTIKDDLVGTANVQDQVRDLLKHPCASIGDLAARHLLFAVYQEEVATVGEAVFNAQLTSHSGAFEHFLDISMPEVEELVVHMFDYFHFYNRSPTEYIEAVWLSSAARPTLEARTRSFVERTLIALAAKTFGENDDWRGRARDDFLAVLDQLKMPEDSKKRIRMLLTDEDSPDCWPGLKKWLQRNEGLIIVFHLLFKSPRLAEMLQEEPLLGAGPERSGRDYAMRPLIFWSSIPPHEHKFSNPLRMLSQFARDADHDDTKALWLLYMLAFNYHDVGRVSQDKSETI